MYRLDRLINTLKEFQKVEMQWQRALKDVSELFKIPTDFGCRL